MGKRQVHTLFTVEGGAEMTSTRKLLIFALLGWACGCGFGARVAVEEACESEFCDQNDAERPKDCPQGFSGVDCDTNTDDCAQNLCQNGSCVDGLDSYFCDCTSGYEGDFCEENTDNCSPNPCENNGTCEDGLDAYRCHCPSGFGGLHCESTLGEDPTNTPPPPSDPYPFDDRLRLHHVQVKGTHNSYHREPFIAFHPSHRYSHVSLDEQLSSQGVRAFELDLHYGGPDTAIDVFHLPIIDENTNCTSFTECISTLKDWSNRNPDHLPLMVWMEMKSGTGGAEKEAILSVESRIEAVFTEDQLLTPATVRKEHSSIREALEGDGWPTLGEVRGRLAFIILSGGAHTNAYLSLYPEGVGGLVFPSAGPSEFDTPWAAFAKINSPYSSEIEGAHTHRILVASNICMADSSDEDCFDKRNTGMVKGVTMLKDDFPGPVSSRSYWLEFEEGKPAQCNLKTAPSFCTSALLENPGNNANP